MTVIGMGVMANRRDAKFTPGFDLSKPHLLRSKVVSVDASASPFFVGAAVRGGVPDEGISVGPQDAVNKLATHRLRNLTFDIIQFLQFMSVRGFGPIGEET